MTHVMKATWCPENCLPTCFHSEQEALKQIGSRCYVVKLNVDGRMGFVSQRAAKTPEGPIDSQISIETIGKYLLKGSANM